MTQSTSPENELSGQASQPKIFQVSCAIDGIEPPVFRRIQVRDCNLAKLHEILQAVLGWQNRQLHYFDIEGREYTSDRKAIAEFEWENAARITLSQLWKKGISEFSYIYDMSHNWVHSIVIEGPEEREPRTHYPYCIEADRACPMENCTGPKQYEQWIQAWANPEHPQHKLACERLGPGFEPEIRSVDPINEKLKRIRN